MRRVRSGAFNWLRRHDVSASHIFVSALNDSGGGYFTRLLDGHPSLAVYPFELQLGTQGRHVGYDEWFSSKYRWPQLPERPQEIFDVLPNEEVRAAQRREPKFAGYALDLDIEEWRAAFEHELNGASDRGHVVSTLLRTFFAAWHDGPGDSARTIVAHCPVLALDWELIRVDLPHARMLHVVRSPFPVYADTKRRRPAMDARGLALRWSLVNTVAAMHAARRPDEFRIVRYDELLRSPEDVMGGVCDWLGIDFDDVLLTPAWNGRVLDRMGPFGGVPHIGQDYEHAQAKQLTETERDILRSFTSAARVLVSLDPDQVDPDGAELRENFTEPATNLTLAAIATKDVPVPLEYETLGDFWGLLDELDVALLVTREYEHLLVLIGGDGGRPWQSAMAVPHPSGAFVRPADGALVVSSTRTPNQLLWFERVPENAWEREIVPKGASAENNTLFLPTMSRVLPGSLYIHDVVMSDDEVYVTVTGHNFVARVDLESGWERVWWPRVLDDLGPEAFAANWLQLNSIGLGPAGLHDAFFTAFSDETGGAKPWKAGYGPKGRGVVFSAGTRDVVLRGLTCPHSATVHDGALWLCDSGFGSVGVSEAGTFNPAARLPGFTRGLAFAGRYVIVGISKVIPRYEPYAPGIDPSASRCGLAIVDTKSGEIPAQLWWPEGLQIYDVQVLSDTTRPMLPSLDAATGAAHLSFLG